MQLTIETERFVLRPFTLDDAVDVQRLVGDKAIAATTLSIPHPYEDGMAETWIASHRAQYDAGEKVTFAIARKADDTLVGSISLMDIAAGHQAELGYWIGRPYWNQGVCTEATQAILRHAFVNLALVRVHACHLTRNPSSGRVMQKVGMRHEGMRRHHVEKWGVVEDMEMYGILKEDWTAISGADI